MIVMLRRFWIRITTDRRRFAVMCAALLVGMLLWARVIIIAKMPRQAIADPAPVDPAPSPPVERAPDPLRLTLDAQAVRDPFIINPDYFPEITPVTNLPAEAGKSDSEAVEDREQASARAYAQLRALVERFDLEAVMTGAPMAVINGRTYRQGEEVPAVERGQVRFRLAEVRQRSVILTCEEHRFELLIEPPGNQ